MAMPAGGALSPVYPEFGKVVASPPDNPELSDEANVPLISLENPNGKIWAPDANIEWDKTIWPRLGFRVDADADARISHDLYHDASPGEGTGHHYVFVAAEQRRRTHGSAGQLSFYFDDLMTNTLGKPIVE
jgi:hypothetical protein